MQDGRAHADVSASYLNPCLPNSSASIAVYELRDLYRAATANLDLVEMWIALAVKIYTNHARRKESDLLAEHVHARHI